MKNLLLLIFASALITLSGCTHRLTDFTIISTKNIDLTKVASFKKGTTRAEGMDKVHIILFIPTGVPNMKEAIDRAIQQTTGCVALLDGVLYQRTWWIPLIYGQNCYVIEGTPLIDPSIASNGNANELPDYITIIINKNGLATMNKLIKEDYIVLKEKIIKKKHT